MGCSEAHTEGGNVEGREDFGLVTDVRDTYN